jgi:hypothetical protein
MSRPVFAPGSVLTVREVLHGQVWLHFPETVVADDGDILAAVQADGCPLTFPEHPFGRHPWSHVPTWRGTTVLKLRRTDTAYSVWKLFHGASFRQWYINFEQPVVRRPDGVDIDDHQLDLVVEPDGTRRWKDVEDLGPALASGRIDARQLRTVLDAAAEVVDRLDRDDRWWTPWDDWSPPLPA